MRHRNLRLGRSRREGTAACLQLLIQIMWYYVRKMREAHHTSKEVMCDRPRKKRKGGGKGNKQEEEEEAKVHKHDKHTYKA